MLALPALPSPLHSPATQDVQGAHGGQHQPGQALHIVDVSADGEAAALETRGLVDQDLGTWRGELGPTAIPALQPPRVLARCSPVAHRVSPRQGNPGRRRSPNEAAVAGGDGAGTSDPPPPPLKPELVFGSFSFKNKLFWTLFYCFPSPLTHRTTFQNHTRHIPTLNTHYCEPGAARRCSRLSCPGLDTAPAPQ